MFEAHKAEFESKVRFTADCWLWENGNLQNGYGKARFQGKSLLAHRVAYILYNGPIPENLIVRHTCDVRNCVNPKHLIVGTQQENIQDAVSRGRLATGEAHGKSILSKEDVRQIRDLTSCGLFTQRKIAEVYKTSKENVSSIHNGRSWKTSK